MPIIRKCLVCGQRPEEAMRSFYKFPNNPTEAAKWKKSLGIPEEQNLVKSTLVCSLHFEGQYLGKKKLLREAVPTLHLGKDRTSPFINPNERCSIESCQAEGKLFPFPTSEIARSSWIRVCNLKPESTKEKLMICSRHFHQDFIGSLRLKVGAFPIKYLESDSDSSEEVVSSTDATQAKSPVKRTLARDVIELTNEEIAELSGFEAKKMCYDLTNFEEDLDDTTHTTTSDCNPEQSFAEREQMYQRIICEQNKRIEELEAQLKAAKYSIKTGEIPHSGASSPYSEH